MITQFYHNVKFIFLSNVLTLISKIKTNNLTTKYVTSEKMSDTRDEDKFNKK